MSDSIYCAVVDCETGMCICGEETKRATCGWKYWNNFWESLYYKGHILCVIPICEECLNKNYKHGGECVAIWVKPLGKCVYASMMVRTL